MGIIRRTVRRLVAWSLVVDPRDARSAELIPRPKVRRRRPERLYKSRRNAR